MKRKPVPVPVESFYEPIRHFIELDRELLSYMFEHREDVTYKMVQTAEFLDKASAAFIEEQNSWPREITFGDFILETLEIYTFNVVTR